MKAGLLLFLFNAILPAQETCALSGTVVDEMSGRPVDRVKVFAGPANDYEFTPPVRRLTNTNGQFCFERLSPGSYKIISQKAGYLDPVYGDGPPHGPPLTVTVSAVQPPLPALVLKITPQGVISGVVTDADGDPISFAKIRLRRVPKVKGSPPALRAEEADEQGRFRLWGVAPGRYYLSALPPSLNSGNMSGNWANSLDRSGRAVREREVETFYKGALGVSGATPIAIKVGQEITELTIPIQKTGSRRIAGRILWERQSGDLPRLLLSSEEGFLFESIQVDKDGHFHVEGLAAGEYTVFGFGPNPNVRVRKEVDVTEADAEEILLQPAETFSVKKFVHVEGSTSEMPMNTVELEGADGAKGLVLPDEDGTWRFGALGADTYRVVLLPSRERYFVKRVVIDGEPQANNVIDLRARHPQMVEVILAVGTGSVTVRVTNGKEPAPAATIVLMDEAAQEIVRAESGRADTPLEVPSLGPGQYRLYALEDFDREAWASKDLRALLATKSVLIELRDGERSKISLPFISKSESDLALRKIQ